MTTRVEEARRRAVTGWFGKCIICRARSPILDRADAEAWRTAHLEHNPDHWVRVHYTWRRARFER